MHRKLILAAAIGLAVANASVSSASDEVRSHGGRVDFILHDGKKPFSIPVGTTYLDPLRNFDCRSAKGCLVSVVGVLEFTNASPQLCSFVDGNPTFPTCGYPATAGDITAFVNFLGSAKVGPGTHTFQSAVNNSYSNNGMVDEWEVQYTVYEIGR